MSELALDSSALSRIYELPAKDRDAVIIGLRLLGRLRITSVNIFEAAAHGSDTLRRDKLRFYRALTGAVNPLDLPNELLEKTASAHHAGSDTVSLGSPHAMRLLHEPTLLTRDLFDESSAWDEGRRESFRKLHEELRTTYQAHFKNIPSDRARTAPDLISYFCERLDTYLESLIIPAYERACGQTISKKDARAFIEGCAAWRVFWAARVHALYSRSIQATAYGDRTNAGQTDLESSIYLAFTDHFITADRKQYEAFNDLNEYNYRRTKVHWWPNLKEGFHLA